MVECFIGYGICDARFGQLSDFYGGDRSAKRTYLPGIISGARLGAFALTEPTAGSDVAAMRCRADAGDGGFILNGEKTYISNAGIAGQYVVFAKSDPDAGRRGITAYC